MNTGSAKPVGVHQPPLVVIVSPGGESGAGGISRMVGYLSIEFEKMSDRFSFRVIDSLGRGERFSQGVRFIGCLLVTLGLCLFSRVSVAHIHVASRGSAFRKYFVVLIFRLFKIPIILHLHGAQFHLFTADLSPFMKNRVKSMFENSERVIVLGEAWKKFVCQTFGVDPEVVRVVHNGTPAISFTFSRVNNAKQEISILFLGRLGERKGVPELLSALSVLAKENGVWKATLAGDGEVQKFRDTATVLGLERFVSFPGWVGREEVIKLLKEADIFVLPSHNEGLPVSVLEAMSCGLAIIATDVGAVTEAVEDNISGIIVKPGDVEGLTNGIKKMLTDSALRQDLGEQAKIKFDTMFNIEICAKNTAKVYFEVCQLGS